MSNAWDERRASLSAGFDSFKRKASLGAKEFGAKADERLSMEGEIQEALEILQRLATPDVLLHAETEKKIPSQILTQAKGLAFFTEVKAGFLFSAKGGTGIVIARLPGGGWSAPSCFGAGGVGAGLMVGVSKTSNIIVLNNQDAIDVFAGKGQLKLGADVEVTAGPVGRNSGVAARGGDGGFAPCYSYSHSQGAYLGVSIDGTVLVTKDSINNKFYGRKVSAKEVLKGSVMPPEVCQPLEDLYYLLKTLESRALQDRLGDAANAVSGGVRGAAVNAIMR
jgi:lipid-binding SYLF domain-containing protein